MFRNYWVHLCPLSFYCVPTRQKTQYKSPFVPLSVGSRKKGSQIFWQNWIFFKKCEPLFLKKWLIEKPWLSATPDRPGAMEKIRQLEASKGRIPTDLDQDQKGFGIPVFIEHLNDLECLENENIKFKCKVEPKNDPTLQIGKYLYLFPRVVN